MLAFPKSTFGRVGFFIVLGALSQACSSSNDGGTGTGGAAGSSAGSENAGSSNVAGQGNAGEGTAGDTSHAGSGNAGESAQAGQGNAGEAAQAGADNGGAAGAVAAGGRANGGAAGEVTQGGAENGGVAGEVTQGGAENGGAAGTVAQAGAENGGAAGTVAQAGAENGGAAGAPTIEGGLVKFCNDLTLDDQDITLTIDFGGTILEASTGTCAPVTTCQNVAAGTGVTVELSMDGESLSTYTVDVVDGDEMLIKTELDTSGDSPTPALSIEFPVGICSGGDATPGTVAKFCNYLARTLDDGTQEDFVATLDIDGTTIEAASGTCAPIAACTAISSGTELVATVYDGTDVVGEFTVAEITDGAEVVFELSSDDQGVTLTKNEYAGICAPAETVSHRVILVDQAPPVGDGWQKGTSNIVTGSGVSEGYTSAR